jgi:hypothetical protein
MVVGAWARTTGAPPSGGAAHGLDVESSAPTIGSREMVLRITGIILIFA